MLAKTYEENDGRQWFVLTCEPNRETLAASHLIARRFKPYLPTESVLTTRGVRRAKVRVMRPMFRGYLFLRYGLWEGRNWAVESVPGVHRFLRLDDDYAIVPDVQMQTIFDTEQDLAEKAKRRTVAHDFKAGEEVRVAEGVFTGFTAKIESLDGDDRITILLGMLGRATRVQNLAPYELEKL